jgi:hypothetical protein
METVTLKLDRRQVERLQARAKATRRSKAAVIRELIDEHLAPAEPSLHDRSADLCGSVAGRRDSSTRKLTGYGRD